MTLPPLEPRSSTLDAIDAIIARATHARVSVLDEVAYLAGEIDRLRAALLLAKEERDIAVEALKRVINGPRDLG